MTCVYRLHFETGAVGMLLVSTDGTILDVINPEACTILGCKREELVAARHGDLLDTSDPRSKLVLGERCVGKKRSLKRCLLRRAGTPCVAGFRSRGTKTGTARVFGASTLC